MIKTLSVNTIEGLHRVKLYLVQRQPFPVEEKYLMEIHCVDVLCLDCQQWFQSTILRIIEIFPIYRTFSVSFTLTFP